jgi:transcription elongation factor Elf1
MVNIHCSNCQGVFDFDHPSVLSAADLYKVTLTCAWCGVALKAPSDEVYMITLDEYTQRALKRQGHPGYRSTGNGYVQLLPTPKAAGDPSSG